MYDIEMMQMLTLIHAENQYIFEVIRAGLLSKEGREALTFDAYDKEFERIMKRLEKYSPCPDCSYKNRFEKMKNIVRDKGDKNDSRKELETRND